MRWYSMLDYSMMYHADTPLKRLYRGSEMIWEYVDPEPVAGLEPYGTDWVLYSRLPEAIMSYLPSGIFLSSPSDPISMNFTCAESPETIDFTRIKNIRVYGEFMADPEWDLYGGIAALPYSHRTHLSESIAATAITVVIDGESFIDLDCAPVGGDQLLLLYADTGSQMTFTHLEFGYYPDSDVTELSNAVWEQRNFQYSSSTVITCNSQITVPAGKTWITVHSLLSGKASKSCVQFLDANGVELEYGDGWVGMEQNNDHFCSHYQSIPQNTASVVIALGYAPSMEQELTPQELGKCVVCFS